MLSAHFNVFVLVHTCTSVYFCILVFCMLISEVLAVHASANLTTFTCKQNNYGKLINREWGKLHVHLHVSEQNQFSCMASKDTSGLLVAVHSCSES